eukprot:scaffold25967_cov73-Skeletonema_marinoi.AAC.1
MAGSKIAQKFLCDLFSAVAWKATWMEHRFCMRAKLQRYYDVTVVFLSSGLASTVDASEDSAFGYRGLASGDMGYYPPFKSHL